MKTSIFFVRFLEELNISTKKTFRTLLTFNNAWIYVAKYKLYFKIVEISYNTSAAEHCIYDCRVLLLARFLCLICPHLRMLAFLRF